MQKIRSSVLLAFSLKLVLKKFYLSAFQSIFDYRRSVNQRRLKILMQRLSNKTGKIRRSVNWMINTGRINITQRGFYRWKLKVFTNYSETIKMYLQKDKFSAFRSVWNMLKGHQAQNLKKRIKSWQNYSKILSKKSPISSKTLEFFLKLLQVYFSKSFSANFQSFKAKTRKNSHKKPGKSSFLILDMILLNSLRKFFEKWKFQYSGESQEWQEYVTESKKLIKTFALLHKPCVRLEHEDIKTNQPSFRAIYRNLSHFAKRIMKKEFYLWHNSLQKIKINDGIIMNFIFKEKKELLFYRLLPDDRKKMKTLLTQFTRIKKAKDNHKKKTLLLWAHHSSPKALKLLRFETIIYKNRINHQKKQKIFQHLKQNVIYFNNFIDVSI